MIGSSKEEMYLPNPIRQKISPLGIRKNKTEIIRENKHILITVEKEVLCDA